MPLTLPLRLVEANNITDFPLGTFTSAFEQAYQAPWLPYSYASFVNALLLTKLQPLL